MEDSGRDCSQEGPDEEGYTDVTAGSSRSGEQSQGGMPGGTVAQQPAAKSWAKRDPQKNREIQARYRARQKASELWTDRAPRQPLESLFQLVLLWRQGKASKLAADFEAAKSDLEQLRHQNSQLRDTNSTLELLMNHCDSAIDILQAAVRHACFTVLTWGPAAPHQSCKLSARLRTTELGGEVLFLHGKTGAASKSPCTLQQLKSRCPQSHCSDPLPISLSWAGPCSCFVFPRRMLRWAAPLAWGPASHSLCCHTCWSES
jgi:hypothetical protein